MINKVILFFPHHPVPSKFYRFCILVSIHLIAVLHNLFHLILLQLSFNFEKMKGWPLVLFQRFRTEFWLALSLSLNALTLWKSSGNPELLYVVCQDISQIYIGTGIPHNEKTKISKLKVKTNFIYMGKLCFCLIALRIVQKLSNEFFKVLFVAKNIRRFKNIHIYIYRTI